VLKKFIKFVKFIKLKVYVRSKIYRFVIPNLIGNPEVNTLNIKFKKYYKKANKAFFKFLLTI